MGTGFHERKADPPNHPAAVCRPSLRRGGFERSIMTVTLIGRQSEVEAIDVLLDRAARGVGGGVLVLVGPPGAGKTALLDAAAARARRRRFAVYRAAPPPGQPGRLVWAQLLQDVGAPQDVGARLLADATPLDLDRAARELVGSARRLILVDDLERAGPDAVEVVAVLAARVLTASTAVIVASSGPLGVGQELRLRALGEDELAAMVDTSRRDILAALWIASRGMPGPARALARSLAGLGQGADPLVHLALQAESRTSFLDVDVELTRLLEAALGGTSDDATRARLLARLARELLGDAAAGVRRRSLVDEAVELARRTGDRQVLAEALDARLHALWDPAGAEDRLAAGSEIIDLARAAGDDARERHGLFWRFVALVELGRIAEAESALAAYERDATVAGDAEAATIVIARRAMLAILRGRFEEASRLTNEVNEVDQRAGVADTKFVVGTLQGVIDSERNPDGLAGVPEMLLSLAHRFPGHYFEATAARILATLGRGAEAGIELERMLPQVLAGTGPRWVGAAADLSVAAVAAGNATAAARLYEALSPYAGRLVVLAGAAITAGPVSHYLGLLRAQVADPAAALDHFQEAITFEERIGALPFLAHSLTSLATVLISRGGPGDLQAASESRQRARWIAQQLGMTVLLGQLSPPPDEWSLIRDGDSWLLEAGGERTRLPDIRGVEYLRALVAAPGRDIPALDLAAGGAGLVGSQAGPVLDASALQAYRRRLAELDQELDAADRAGDPGRAEQAAAERQGLLREVRRATGTAGRQRQVSSESERARVNVTRTLRTAVDRIAVKAPLAAAHLRSSLRTGRACRYEPGPGGPVRWHV